MSNGGRKSLMWDIRKSLLTLSAEELFRVARAVDPELDADQSEPMERDQEPSSSLPGELAFQLARKGMALKTKPPKTVGDLRRVLGFLSYYRFYVQDFAKIAKPLYELLQVEFSMPQPPPRHCKSRGPQLLSKTPIEWKADHQSTLERLVGMLTKPPVLAYPNFEEPFVLHTDASEKGLGAIFYQQ
ncbi:Retrovirus-related Pol polyprotein from transposon opus Protease [Larimichthys crocea]|uniref:Retrovirus-related Pol polyprotein from transposon opus Protease n=1 Tax=Larimichthys crocea TaxID=215358 RepID=A0A6G0IN12_LARCR|nr:Retrovirus-related Pol polyprotein from transposon opus Protease [Larimichthys crocea]